MPGGMVRELILLFQLPAAEVKSILQATRHRGGQNRNGMDGGSGGGDGGGRGAGAPKPNWGKEAGRRLVA